MDLTLETYLLLALSALHAGFLVVVVGSVVRIGGGLLGLRG